MRFTRFLKEDEPVSFNFSYPGSDKDISFYYKQQKEFDIVMQRGDETETNTAKRALNDLMSMMKTKQIDYDRDVKRLI